MAPKKAVKKETKPMNPVAKKAPKTAKPAAERAVKTTTASQPRGAVSNNEAQGAASALITAHLRQLGDWRGEKLTLVRKLIHEADPAIIEEWKWDIPVWSHDGIICTGETYKEYVKLTFAKGAFLADPHKVFNTGFAGNVRRAVDIRAQHEISPPSFRDLIREAVAYNQDHLPKSRRASGKGASSTW